MKYNWKKYLFITSFISVILGLVIPETIEYLERINDAPSTSLGSSIDINLYGLLWKLFYRTLFWFCISFCSFSVLGFIYLLFKKQNSELK